MTDELRAESGPQGAKSARRRVANITVLVCAFTFGALSSELLIRLTFKDRIVLFPRYHTGAQYGEYTLRRLRPSSTFWHTSADGTWEFVTNAQGFRDTEDYSYGKRPGLYRVLCLGDSHTLGFECRQDRTYAVVLERFLRREGVDAQVMNTGISGFGTAEELAFLENEGFRYDPDVVVVGLFANDFEDNMKSGLYALDGLQLVPRAKAHVPGVAVLDLLNSVAPLSWLSQHSYFFSGTMNAVWDAAKLALLSRARARLATEAAIATGPISDRQQTLMAALFKRMYQECSNRGIRLVVLDVPGGDDRGAVTSVPAAMVGPLGAHSDALLLSDQLLREYEELGEFHVPHGQRHISELTHLILGLAAGREILTAKTAVPGAGRHSRD